MKPVDKTKPSINREARAIYRAFHILSPGIVVAVGLPAGVLVLLTKGHEFCTYKTEYLPDFWLFALGAAAFVAGHYVGLLGTGQVNKITDDSKRFGRLVIVTAFLVSGLVFTRLLVILTFYVAGNWFWPGRSLPAPTEAPK
jgi:hypothetical protein